MKDVISRDEWEQMVNDINMIKASTQATNHILAQSQLPALKFFIFSVVKTKKLCNALLYSKEDIEATKLAEMLSINISNLARDIKPLTDNGLLTPKIAGRRHLYKRATYLDLINFDRFPETVKLSQGDK